MGGRGSNLDVNTYLGWSHQRRISEFETIYEDGNIKFLMQKEGTRTAAPIFSNTAGRIYVTMNSAGQIKGITQYGRDHKQIFSINEAHEQDKIKEVHVHSSIETGRKITYWNDMPHEQKELYHSIKNKINEYGILEKVKEFNKKYGK